MSPMAVRRPLKSTVRPSGEMFGDSGLSTVSQLNRRSILPVSTFWMISVLYFLVADEVGEAIADRRPRHPRHHVAEARLRDVLEAAIHVEARA